MKTEVEKRYQAALEAVRHLFECKTVPPSEIRESLQSLIDEIQILIETLSRDEWAGQ